MQQPTRKAKLPQAGRQPQVVADVVADVSPPQEGRLSDINHVVQGALKAVGNDGEDQLGVTVQEGDRTIPRQLVAGLTRLGHKADDTP